MKLIDSTPPVDVVKHTCNSHKEGDWIIFSCPQCSEYLRKINYITGKMIVQNSTPDICHTGEYNPMQVEQSLDVALKN